MLQNRNQTIFIIFSLPVVVVMGFLFKYYTQYGSVSVLISRRSPQPTPVRTTGRQSAQRGEPPQAAALGTPASDWLPLKSRAIFLLYPLFKGVAAGGGILSEPY
ncbi:hypothetical protein NIES4074_40060 [Cylindrospermum sp. NIES-4074]|nr:hypothetical protein NIES4074_40060 [Cylindrospermum sp. NIES-4074]